MNPLFKPQQQSPQQSAPQAQSKPTLNDFLRMTTPEGAKAQLEQMIGSGQVSREAVNSLMVQAQQMARVMGLK